jgi:ribose/xylose/arabinose/galactoside ABC-type transport system permease subunit
LNGNESAKPAAVKCEGVYFAAAKKHYLILILFSILILGKWLSPNFLSLYNVQSFLIMLSIYGFLAIGQSMVMFVSEINMSLGSQMAFAPIAAMFVTKQVFAARGIPFISGNIYIVDGLYYLLIFTLVFGAALGFLTGLIIVRFKVPSLVITLGMMYVLGGGCYMLAGQFNMFLSKLPHVGALGSGLVGPIPVAFILFSAATVSIVLLMKYTRFGNRLYATGGNEKAAIYAGIDTRFWKVVAFTASGLCASVSAVIYSSRMESIDPLQGSGLLYYTIAISVIGGINMMGGSGSILGTAVGSAILAIAINIMQMSAVDSWYQTIIVGTIIVIAAMQQMKHPSR